ncbi:hypothetical protein [Actinoplanes sp. NPDC051851]|uniref:hypothetical protein n=1 Tax=Actinoplanes sp. NPDC051851 TaxID=3154753 RepID=UPI003441C233
MELPGPDFPAGLIVVEDVAIRGLTHAKAAVEVAEGVQRFIAEVHRFIWPVCTQHGPGLMHPELHQGRAFWICGQGPHPFTAVSDRDTT